MLPKLERNLENENCIDDCDFVMMSFSRKNIEKLFVINRKENLFVLCYFENLSDFVFC